jgi:hypothetical protein
MRACELREKGALFESKSMESTNARARERVDERGGGYTRLEWLGARFKAR